MRSQEPYQLNKLQANRKSTQFQNKGNQQIENKPNIELEGKLKIYNEVVNQILTQLYEQQQQQSRYQYQTKINEKHQTSINKKYQTSKSKKHIEKLNTNNIRQLFDLMVYFDRKQPHFLETIIELNLIQKIIDTLSAQQFLTHIKSFILLIANCTTHGMVIDHLIKSQLIDKILIKYLQSIRSIQTLKTSTNYLHQNKTNHQHFQSLPDEQGGIQYLGSLLKAATMHINSNTYPYFCKRTQKDIQFTIKQDLPVKKETNSKVKEDSNFNIQKDTQQIDQKKLRNKKVEDFFDIFDAHINQTNTNFVNNQSYLNQERKNISPNQIITSETKQVFTTKDKYECLLLKVCTKFYNCPEELTRTTVINIVMRLLRQTYAKQMISDPLTNKYHDYIIEWGWNMCCGLKNELKNLSQKLMVIQSPHELDIYVQQLNDIVILWQDLTLTQLKQLYQENFLKIVIHSLLIGSLNTSSMPMFNINFTFYILAKFMTVFTNLQLIEKVSQLLFTKTLIVYEEKLITTAMLKSFDIKNILSDQDLTQASNILQKSQNKLQYPFAEVKRKLSDDSNHTDRLKFQGVNQFFLSMLKSKDQNFLFIGTNLLYQILTHLRNLPHSHRQKLFSNFALNINGHLLTKITSILINQLRHDHPLMSLKRILELIIFIQPSFKFNEENTNEFVFFYKEVLIQTLELIQSGKQYHPYVVETFQYDMKWLEAGILKCQGWTDQQLLKQNSWIEQQNQQIHQGLINQKLEQLKRTFSTKIPQKPSQILRYKIIKTFLLLKFNQLIIQNKQTHHILSKYVQKLKIWEEKQPKPGDKLPYPLKQKFHQCKLIEQKTQIPWLHSIIIEDDVNLIIGFVEANFVKIIVNIKLKHVHPEIFTKKDKTYIKINFNRFDYVTECLTHKSYLLIRGFSTGIQYFAVKRQNFKEKEINSIKKGLKRTFENLPDISLL